MKKVAFVCLALLLSLGSPLYADVVFLSNGKSLEGTIISEDEKGITLKIRFGTLYVATSKILRIDRATPSENETRETADRVAIEARAQEERKNAENGKVFYKGAWVPLAQKLSAERNLARSKYYDESREYGAREPAPASDFYPPAQARYDNGFYDYPYYGGGGGVWLSPYSYGSRYSNTTRRRRSRSSFGSMIQYPYTRSYYPR